MGKKTKIKHEVFVVVPKIEPYYGVRVNADTKLKFANQNVKQKLENLVLTSEYTVKDERFLSKTKVEYYLKEGEILLLEESGKGYFATQSNIGTLEDAQAEFDFMKEQVAKIPQE